MICHKCFVYLFLCSKEFTSSCSKLSVFSLSWNVHIIAEIYVHSFVRVLRVSRLIVSSCMITTVCTRGKGILKSSTTQLCIGWSLLSAILRYKCICEQSKLIWSYVYFHSDSLAMCLAVVNEKLPK